MDLGGTNIRAVVGDAKGKFLSHVRIPTRATEGRDAVLARMKECAREALTESRQSWEAIAAIGLAAPGPLDHDKGIIYDPPNLPGWKEVPLKQLFEDEFRKPTFVGNDANLGAVAERRFGQGKGLDHLIYVTVSTGIGGGIIAHGRLLLGVGGTAAEVGHTVVDMHGPRCPCGNSGCAEAIAAGPAIARAAIRGLQEGAASSLHTAKPDPRELTAADVVAAAKAGDAFAQQVIRQAGTAVGVLVVNLINLFNPQMIVIGGGVTNAGDLLFTPIHEQVRARALRAPAEQVKVVPSHLGDDVVLYGALAWALEQVEKGMTL